MAMQGRRESARLALEALHCLALEVALHRRPGVVSFQVFPPDLKLLLRCCSACFRSWSPCGRRFRSCREPNHAGLSSMQMYSSLQRELQVPIQRRCTRALHLHPIQRKSHHDEPAKLLPRGSTTSSWPDLEALRATGHLSMMMTAISRWSTLSRTETRKVFPTALVLSSYRRPVPSEQNTSR